MHSEESCTKQGTLGKVKLTALFSKHMSTKKSKL